MGVRFSLKGLRPRTFKNSLLDSSGLIAGKSVELELAVREDVCDILLNIERLMRAGSASRTVAILWSPFYVNVNSYN